MLDKTMTAMSHLGDATTQIGLCLVLSTCGNEKAQETAKLGSFALTGTAVTIVGLKYVTNRKRPEGETNRGNSSFPSGHTGGAFALAAIFGEKYPKIKFAGYTIASLVGLSRIYLGRHYPSDVLGGAAVGFIISRIVLHYEKRLLRFNLW